MKGHEAAGAFYAALALLCLGFSDETWVMGALGGGLAAVAAAAWLWRPARRRA